MTAKIVSSACGASAGREGAKKAAAAVVGLAISALVGGCAGGDSKPSALPSLTATSTSASASRSSTAVRTPPAEAREKTSAGAAAFVRFYIGLINDAYRTGATGSLRKYAGPTCDSCKSIAAAVDDIYKNGGHAQGGLLTIERTAAAGIKAGVQPTVVVDVAVTPFEEIDADGKVVDQEGERRTVLLVDLDWVGAWRVNAVRDQEGNRS